MDDFEKTESRFFRAWAEVVLAHKVFFLGLTALLTTLGIQQIVDKLYMDTGIDAFIEGESDAALNLERFRDQFGRDDVLMVMVEGDVFSEPFLRSLKALHDELATIDLELESLGQRRFLSETHAAALAPPRDVSQGSTASAGEAAPNVNEDDTFDDFGDFDEVDALAGDVEDMWSGEEGGTVIEEITSLINIRKTQGRTITTDGGQEATELVVGKLFATWPDEHALPAIKAEALSDPAMVNRVVSSDGRYAMIILRTQFMTEEDTELVHDEAQRIGERYERSGFSVYYGGLPALGGSLRRLILSEFATLGGLALLTFTLVMLLIFRHPLGVIGPLAVVAVSGIWTASLMAISGMPVTMLSQIIPSFIICIGMGDSVHIISVYRDARRKGVENERAVIHAVAMCGTPVAFTTLTTMSGLLSFNAGTIGAVGQLGNAGAFGVSMALLNTLVILPIVLSWNKKSLLGLARVDRSDWIDRFLSLCNGASKRSLRGTLIGGALLAGLALAGMSQMHVWHNPIAWIPASDPASEAFEKMDSHLGGSGNVQLLIETSTALGIKDLELLRSLEKLEAHIREFEHPSEEYGKIVGGVISILDVVRETNRALHGGDEAHYRLPDTQAELADTLFLFENAGPDELRKLASTDLSITQMTIRITWLEATSYEPFARHIDEGIARYIDPDRVEVRTTGVAYTMLTTVSSLIRNIIMSFSVAVLIITLLMIALLRDFRLGLIAMVPNLLPIAAVGGFMGFVDIPIDMANLLIASIAIGIAVDDTIHFLYHFKVRHKATGDVEVSLKDAFFHAGRAMVSTTLILSFGFAVYIASSMVSILRFGLLIAMTVVLALVIDLIFAPALIRATHKDVKVKGS